MEMWGVIPRVLNFKTYDEMFTTEVSFEQIANAIQLRYRWVGGNL